MNYATPRHGALIAALALMPATGHAQATPAPPAASVCAAPPATGAKLAGDLTLGEEGHAIEITNGGGGDSLVKLRHAATGRLAASFFIRANETMTIEGVPDGDYTLQYAFGPALAADCRSFTRIIKANAFPGSDVMKTEVIDDADHTEVKRGTWTYGLQVAESSNMKAIPIDAAAFNAD